MNKVRIVNLKKRLSVLAAISIVLFVAIFASFFWSDDNTVLVNNVLDSQQEVTISNKGFSIVFYGLEDKMAFVEEQELERAEEAQREQEVNITSSSTSAEIDELNIMASSTIAASSTVAAPNQETVDPIGIDELSKKIVVKNYKAKNGQVKVSGKKVNKDDIKTKIVYVDTSEVMFRDAQVNLIKDSGESRINAILKCSSEDFNTRNGSCENWQITKTVFSDDGHNIIFKTNTFSAYVGVYLELINEQSNLTRGDIWEVQFDTYGTETLKIEATDGTSYPEDIEFIGLWCGDRQLTEDEYTFQGQTILANDYNCDNQISKIKNQTVTGGRHWLSLSFGYTQNILAHNFACDSGTLDSTCYVTTQQYLGDGDEMSGTGSLVIQAGGELTASSSDT